MCIRDRYDGSLQQPKNTSKWFLPGIFEHYAIMRIPSNDPEPSQWLTDYPTNEAKYPICYFDHAYITYPKDVLYNDAANYKIDTRYLLAF